MCVGVCVFFATFFFIIFTFIYLFLFLFLFFFFQGFAASFVESPVDLVKTTMQTHYNKKYFGFACSHSSHKSTLFYSLFIIDI